MISVEYLEKKAKQVRRDVTETCIKYGGHIASSLSCVDILVALYHGEHLSISPNTATDINRDRFILSKGHAETALYAVLADRGFISQNLIEQEYRHGDCGLGGHPSHKTTGIEWSTGSLGHGVSVAAGQALVAKIDNLPRHHFVLVGDSECTEGSIWEAAMFSATHELDNLTVIVDRNHLGVLESTESFTSLQNLAQKWEAFNWQAYTCDGHDIEDVFSTITKAKQQNNTKPTAIIAETTKGKGIPFIENEALWHVKALNKPDEIALARKVLSEE